MEDVSDSRGEGVDRNSHLTSGRRAMLRAMGATGVAAALAGCSSQLSDALGGESGSGGGEADVPDEPIQAGMQTFTQGAPAVLGLPNVWGAQLARDRINEAGGIAGRQLEIEIVEELVEADSVENHRQFAEDGKDVIFGPTSSGNAENVAPIAEQEGIVTIGIEGTATTVFEEIVTDPQYFFRAGNMNTCHSVALALEVVERMDEINTVAGINPNYAYGQNSFSMFQSALGQLTDFDTVYAGFPDIGTTDMSSHIQEVVNQEPDITYSALWGGDAATMMSQAAANDMFENTRLIGPILNTALPEIGQQATEAAAGSLFGNKAFYFEYPPWERWTPMQETMETTMSEYSDGQVPTYSFLDGYMAVASYATAAEKAVDIIGGWPSQEQLARALENHGFYTPGGYHVIRESDHQTMSHTIIGSLAWDSDMDHAVLNDLNIHQPWEVAPPPGVKSREWIESWG